jgi:biopolymer transport protein ExbD
MNLRSHPREEPEINLIPFIDVLLVVVIFLMLSTTYARFTELKITLPTADAENTRDRPRELLVSVSADGRYAINRAPVLGRNAQALVNEMASAAQGQKDTMVIIHADAMASHQSVVHVMEAARVAGLSQITFATQSPTK